MKSKFLDFSNLKGDAFGGITAGIVALPLALAFGVQSGMGAAAGLYGAFAIGLIASLFGGTPVQISGPTGPMTVVSAALIAQNIESYGTLEKALPMILATFILAGILQIVFGLIRAGSTIRFIPYPVVSGFMSGIGVIIVVLQIFPFFGHSSPKSIVSVFTEIGTAIGSPNMWSVLLALITIAIIYLFPRITKAIPSTLVALILVSFIPVLISGIDVSKIGDIPSGLPELVLGKLAGFELSDLGLILAPAFSLAMLGTIDSLLTSVVADNITKTKHNSNKELIGQGLGNVAASVIGGIPGAGATMRTVVNVNAGGKTKLSGVFHALLLLVILVGASSFAAEIPLPVLAGILITVGIGIVDYKGLKHIKKIPVSDVVVMFIVLFVTVFFDLLVAVGIGMVLSLLIFLYKMEKESTRKSSANSVSQLKKEDSWSDELNVPDSIADDIYVKHLDGPLFFGFTSKFQELAESIPDIKVLIIRMEKVPFIDQSGLYAFEDVVFDLNKKGIKVLLTGLEDQPKDQLGKVQIIPSLIPNDQLFDTFDQSIHWAKENIA